MAFRFENRWLAFSFRWLLGLTFIIASIHKIENPAAFAKVIYGYGLFPHFTINLLAIVLPFLELITGFCLLFNFRSKAAALLVAIMLIAFIIAISVNLIRGHEFDCGCFSFHSENPLTGTKFLLVRDFILLMFCAYTLRYSGSKNK